MDYMSKIKIYCAFTGTGKTYFCQHHNGWVDIDEEPFVRLGLQAQSMMMFFDRYTHYGYKIMTCATPYVLHSLAASKQFEIIIILPSAEMKQEILDRIKERGDATWAEQLTKLYDNFYTYVDKYPYALKKIYLQPGQYISDVIGETLD